MAGRLAEEYLGYGGREELGKAYFGTRVDGSLKPAAIGIVGAAARGPELEMGKTAEAVVGIVGRDVGNLSFQVRWENWNGRGKTF